MVRRAHRVRIPGYAALAHDLDLLRRLRGGIGEVLLEGASAEAIAGQPCPWDPPCTFDILFREQGRAGVHGIPKPYALAAERRGRDLVVAMTLFGLPRIGVPPRRMRWWRPYSIASIGAASGQVVPAAAFGRDGHSVRG